MNSKLIFWIPLMIALFFLGIYFNAKTHEETHAKIDEYFGAENISIHYEYFGILGAYETADYQKDTDLKLVYSLHSINEIIGYQYSILYLFFFFTVIFLGIIYFSKEKCPNCGYDV